MPFETAENGRVWAAGVGDGGRLGLGDERTRIEAEMVRGLPENVTFITASSSRSAAVTRNGVLYLWGNGVLVPTRFVSSLKVRTNRQELLSLLEYFSSPAAVCAANFHRLSYVMLTIL